MYFEDYKIGDKYFLDEEIVNLDEMVEFAKEYDPRPFHLDKVSAEKTRFDDIIASGFFTLAFSWSKWVKTKKDEEGMIAGRGINNLSWTKPVYANDRLKSSLTVLDKIRSSSKNQGIVKLSYLTTNQKDEKVLYFEAEILVKTRTNKGWE